MTNQRTIRAELKDWHKNWSKKERQLNAPLEELTAQTLFGERHKLPFLPIMRWVKSDGMYVSEWLSKDAPYQIVNKRSEKEIQEANQIGEFYGFWTKHTSNAVGYGYRRENGRSDWKNLDEICVRLWRLYNTEEISPSEFTFRKLQDTDLDKVPRNQPIEIIPLETSNYFVYRVRLYG